MPLKPPKADETAIAKIRNANFQPRFIAALLFMNRAEGSAKFRRRIGRETVAHDVFGYDPRDHELEQVIAAAGLRSAARHLESTEGMAPNDGARAGAIDVNIAGDQLRFHALDVRRAAREESGGQRVVGVVRDADRFVEIAHF